MNPFEAENAASPSAQAPSPPPKHDVPVSLSGQALKLATDAALDDRQRRAQLARLAVSTIPGPRLSPATQALLDAGVLCDLFEGPAPSCPRYVLPDYALALRQGCDWLELEPPRALDEALNFLSILYAHIPSVTGYPVWLGHLDALLEPFVHDLDEHRLERQLRLFWRGLDRCLPNGFVHANLGPRSSRVGRAILRLERERPQVVPNLSLLVDPELSDDDFLLEALQTCFASAKPHFVNHPLLLADFGGALSSPSSPSNGAELPYGVASCYNTLPVGGGSYTLIRLNLARCLPFLDSQSEASNALLRAVPGAHPSGLLRSDSPPPGYEFLLHTLPRLVEAAVELLAARSRLVVEQSAFFGRNDPEQAHFLVREGLVHRKRFGAMFGVLGLAELCNTLLEREPQRRDAGIHADAAEPVRLPPNPSPRFGRDPQANRLALRIVERLAELVGSTPLPSELFGAEDQGCHTAHAWLHAQSGIDSDLGCTPGTRIPFADEPELLEHLRVVAPLHAAFRAGVSDPLRLEPTVRQNPRAVLDLMRGAFAAGMRDFTFELGDTEMVRVTGYLVRRRDLERLEHGAARHDSALLSLGSVRGRGLLSRPASRIGGERSE